MCNYPICNLSENEQERVASVLWKEFSSADVEMSYNQLLQTLQNHSLDIEKYLRSTDEIIDFAFERLKITLIAIFFKATEREDDFFNIILRYYDGLTRQRLYNPLSTISYWLSCLDIKKDIKFSSLFGKSFFRESKKTLSDIFSQRVREISPCFWSIQSDTVASNVSSLLSLCILETLSQDAVYPEDADSHRLSLEIELDIIKRGFLYR